MRFELQAAEKDSEDEFPDLGTTRYEFIKFIGSGGEGAVYEAFDKITKDYVIVIKKESKCNFYGK